MEKKANPVSTSMVKVVLTEISEIGTPVVGDGLLLRQSETPVTTSTLIVRTHAFFPSVIWSFRVDMNEI
jgi:hypothetical protein